jgi:hypothetical protein
MDRPADTGPTNKYKAMERDGAVRHICSSRNAFANPKAAKEPSNPSLPDYEIDVWTTKFSYIWTVLKLTLHITRTIKFICLSRFLNFLLSYIVILKSLNPDSAPVRVLKLCVS